MSGKSNHTYLHTYIHTYLPGTILENYFGLQSPMHECELTMQLRCKGSCETPNMVYMDNPSRVHRRNAGKHDNLSVFKASQWKFLDCCDHSP